MSDEKKAYEVVGNIHGYQRGATIELTDGQAASSLYAGRVRAPNAAAAPRIAQLEARVAELEAENAELEAELAGKGKGEKQGELITGTAPAKK